MSEAMVAVPVRPAAAADLAAVTALLRECDLPAAGVGDQFEDGYVVAEQSGAIVGVAGLEVYGGAGLLRSVAVAPAYRGRGIAAALVADRVGWGRARGLRAIYLLTTTAPSWFAQRSFVSVGRDDVPVSIRRSPEFADVCPTTAHAMTLPLEPTPSACCGSPSLTTAAPSSAASMNVCCTPSDTGARGAELVDVLAAGDPVALKARVREAYGAAAVRATTGAKSSCCGPSDQQVWDPITTDLYDEGETRGLPAEAMLASLGCGNPTALAQLQEGETVLDLGSGGGIDVLLSARRVGPGGKAYGLDMTDEMLALARANQARAGATNVEFLKGDIESIPLPDASVDVVISNCVINLAADKSKVLREAFRVLKPGGRFAVSDIVSQADVPSAIRRSLEMWVGCIAGALQDAQYIRLLGEAGFSGISIEPTRVYGSEDARTFFEEAGLEVPDSIDDFDGAFFSGFVRAVKP